MSKCDDIISLHMNIVNGSMFKLMKNSMYVNDFDYMK